MSKKSDINALLDSIQEEFLEIKTAYDKALQSKELPSGLKIKIKNFLENAKSLLDYLAHDICEVLAIQSDKIYFPIVKRDGTEESFS